MLLGDPQDIGMAIWQEHAKRSAPVEKARDTQ